MPHSPQKKHQPERCPYHPDVDENPNDKEISKKKKLSQPYMKLKHLVM